MPRARAVLRPVRERAYKQSNGRLLRLRTEQGARTRAGAVSARCCDNDGQRRTHTVASRGADSSVGRSKVKQQRGPRGRRSEVCSFGEMSLCALVSPHRKHARRARGVCRVEAVAGSHALTGGGRIDGRARALQLLHCDMRTNGAGTCKRSAGGGARVRWVSGERWRRKRGGRRAGTPLATAVCQTQP